jgi:hypothetical protein
MLKVNIDVDDLVSAVEYYTSALGLRLARRLLGGLVAEMLGATSQRDSAFPARWRRA